MLATNTIIFLCLKYTELISLSKSYYDNYQAKSIKLIHSATFALIHIVHNLNLKKQNKLR